MSGPSERPLTETEFAAHAARIGLRLTTEKRAALYETYRGLAELAKRVRGPRELAAEPAVVFTPLGADRR